MSSLMQCYSYERIIYVSAEKGYCTGYNLYIDLTRINLLIISDKNVINFTVAGQAYVRLG